MKKSMQKYVAAAVTAKKIVTETIAAALLRRRLEGEEHSLCVFKDDALGRLPRGFVDGWFAGSLEESAAFSADCSVSLSRAIKRSLSVFCPFKKSPLKNTVKLKEPHRIIVPLRLCPQDTLF